ncbi:hypothetical protein [Marinihelvus fidelis]|uniref:hypothetical protein n=1 Tax=Marinihelvus fidelis TaxID=2613842 RepID=UPI001CD517F1|nr:hypothetical protein [Marinihelvus fidelis]
MLFRAFKYTIYLLLAINIVLFFQEDYLAARETFGSNIGWGNFVEAFSATIDTAAWVVLLLLFELETAVISDERLRGGLKWLLMAVRSICYVFIGWAFWGYLGKLGLVSGHEPFVIANVCELVGTGFTWLSDLDEYLPIDAAACAALSGSDLVRINGTQIIGTPDAAAAAVRLAWVDVINAGDWIIIVLMLEVEVLLQLRGRLTEALMRASKLVKGVLYAILFAAAAYWGVLGDFLDFWDAFLWLVAFIFIEMNIFKWQAETAEEAEPGLPVEASS